MLNCRNDERPCPVTTDVRPPAGPPNPWADPAFVATYDRWGDRQTAALARIALDRSGVTAGARVLDVGTGLGALAVPAAQRGCSVLAFDLSAPMVEVTARRLAAFPDARAVQMDARSFDLDDDSFDAAFGVLSVSLMPHRDESLREMVRVVRPGGLVCVVNWVTRWGSPVFETVTQAMEQLGLMPASAAGLGIPPLEESHLTDVGCVDISVEPIDAPAEMPSAATFFDEVGPFLTVIPGFAALDAGQRAELQALVTREVTDGGPWILQGAIGIGRVP
jgi:SAM-dependent methyltransferase